jgi:hypothetical protein
MRLIRLLKENEGRRALVFGMGGGGDIIATIPTANFLREFGYEVLHGTIIWDRYIIDPEPGPRSLEELSGIEVVNDTIAIAGKDTKIKDKEDIRPTVARAGEFFGEVIALDITKGPKKLAKGIRGFMREFEISTIVGVDSGGDVLAHGFESGVRSPLADAVSLSTLSMIGGSIIGVFGFGSDGELRVEELLLRISKLLERGDFLGSIAMDDRDCDEMMELSKEVITEASMIPIKAFKGEIGISEIRWGRTVIVSPLSILTFYFKSEGVFEINNLARKIQNAESIESARKILNSMGIFTELDFEYLIRDSKA